MIEIKNLTYRYPGAKPSTPAVLDQVSLKISCGEFAAILGPSGCGKSTLLRLVAGLESSSSQEISPIVPEKSYVFQDPTLLPWRSVLKNVTLPLELQGISNQHAIAKAQSQLKRVGLESVQDAYPGELSGGMRMRVSVARALVTEPKLLLLDEPFAALDENTRHGLQDELRSLWEQHRMSVLFVTHSVSEAVFLSNRILVLSKRPARLLKDIPIQLPEKRGPSLRMDQRFFDQINRIYQAVPVTEAPL